MINSLKVLGIESSCDDTAAAVINVFHKKKKCIKTEIKASIVFNQNLIHNEFGGVVPELAARAHVEKLDLSVKAALRKSGTCLNEIDIITVTSGPGLIGGLLSGVMFAKGLAFGLNKPLIGVNHLAGHALTPRLTNLIKYPYLILIASGGHCQYLIVNGPSNFIRLGGTIDDAPGEAFDKTAKILGLNYPGGPNVEIEALQGNPNAFVLPLPLVKQENCDLSFSGLKTALVRKVDQILQANGSISNQEIKDLCASFQNTMVEIFVKKTQKAMNVFKSIYPEATQTIAIAGGVAANKSIGFALSETAKDHNFNLIIPEPKLCTDNAAMIAFAGSELYLEGKISKEALVPRPRWPLDKKAPPMIGFGKKGTKA